MGSIITPISALATLIAHYRGGCRSSATGRGRGGRAQRSDRTRCGHLPGVDRRARAAIGVADCISCYRCSHAISTADCPSCYRCQSRASSYPGGTTPKASTADTGRYCASQHVRVQESTGSASAAQPGRWCGSTVTASPRGRCSTVVPQPLPSQSQRSRSRHRSAIEWQILNR